MAVDERWSPATEAYLWGYPLLAFHRTRRLLCSRTPTGVLNHVVGLATPKDRAVVLPNNDTLYSSGWYDLRYGDLMIDVPSMDHDDRYWNVMVVDAYARVNYVRRRDYGVAGARVRVTWDPSLNTGDHGGDVVRVATPTAWLIVRVLVESARDLPVAQALQRSFSVVVPAQHPQTLTERGDRPMTIGNAGLGFFSELSACLAVDPPAPCHPRLSQQALNLVSGSAASEESTLLAGIETGEALLAAGNGSDTVVQNGWRTGLSAEGPGQDVLRRALAAKYGLGGHYAVENRSYSALHDSAGQPLHGSRPLQLRFGAGSMPPCDAFWSLTAYGKDLFLIENEIDRWSLGDRTPGLRYGSDGSLVIAIAAERPRDVANWLPVPNDSYLLGLRVYEGHDSVVKCRWFPPALRPLSAG